MIDFSQYWTNRFEGSWGPWVGGLQKPSAGEPGDGWGWVTGEDWSYMSWDQNQPDNEIENEDRLHFYAPYNDTRSSYWNDAFAFELMHGFVVEREAPYNNHIEGDINEDGIVDAADFEAWGVYQNDIRQGLASDERWFDPYLVRKGDVDGDSIISDNDYNYLYQIIHGVEPFIIDSFNTDLPPFTVTDQDGTLPISNGTTIEDSMQGGEFDVVVKLSNVISAFDGATVEINDSHFCFTQDSTSTSEVICSWDGVDHSPFEIRASNGLGGGINMADQNDITLDVIRNDSPLNVAVLLFSSVEDSSELNLNIPVITKPTTIKYPFEDFSANGNGVDLSKVTAVVLYIGPGGVTGPQHLEIDRISATSKITPESNEPSSMPDILFDQIHDLPSSGIWSVNYFDGNPFNCISADDFTVSSGQSWNIQEIQFAAEWPPVKLPDSTVNVTIYADAIYSIKSAGCTGRGFRPGLVNTYTGILGLGGW